MEAGELNMEVIMNPKISKRCIHGVIQLETAVGAAIKCFNGACGKFAGFDWVLANLLAISLKEPTNSGIRMPIESPKCPLKNGSSIFLKF